MLIEKERKLLKNNYHDVAKKCVCLRLVFPKRANGIDNFRPNRGCIPRVGGNCNPDYRTTVTTGRGEFNRNSSPAVALVLSNQLLTCKFVA